MSNICLIEQFGRGNHDLRESGHDNDDDDDDVGGRPSAIIPPHCRLLKVPI